MVDRPTCAALSALKGKRQILTMHVDNAEEAAAAADAGMDMFTFEIDGRIEGVRAAAPSVFIQAGYPQGHLASEEIAIREGSRAIERGVDCIYFAGSLRIVEAMSREGIPVTGHVGYVPRHKTWTGVRAVGKTAVEAAAIFSKVKSLESAGAWGVEMELIPSEVASYITKRTSLITEGMGCGAGCDTQYLFSCDVLGTNTGHYPRHAKKYADLNAEYKRLHTMRVAAFQEFAKDVRGNGYPQAKHEIKIADSEFEEFQKLVDKFRS
jgi:3-methyl-2-oxobutanoate hydroxymethyltransferase